jgi:hypothetical protein
MTQQRVILDARVDGFPIIDLPYQNGSVDAPTCKSLGNDPEIETLL